MSKVTDLLQHGQSIWLDFIDRNLVENGGLVNLVEHGIRGVTSNPTIFQKAITSGHDYDSAIRDLIQADHAIDEYGLYHWLTLQDIQAAADIMFEVYKSTNGDDGYVSLEVSPHLANDTQGTIDAARHLWREVKRPNLMIKVPATKEGIPAVETLIAEGINVNVTLLFSLERYEETIQAYLHGLQKNANPSQVASVASFFISRVDSKVDKQLDDINTPEAKELKGKIAIANAALVYHRFREITESDVARKLIEKGARLQRPLWASTGVKNPEYPSLLYVEKLIARDTVNTLPPATLDDFLIHGEIIPALEGDLIFDQAKREISQLKDLGINLDEICDQLEAEGVVAFVESYDHLLGVLKDKCAEVAEDYASV